MVYEFNNASIQDVKCVTLNYGTMYPLGGINGPSPLPWGYTPITVGTQLYMSNTLGAQPYNTLNGNYSIDVTTLNSSTNTGLQLNQKYIIQVNNGVVTNIINFNTLPAC
jgi:hypothetical protein